MSADICLLIDIYPVEVSWCDVRLGNALLTTFWPDCFCLSREEFDMRITRHRRLRLAQPCDEQLLASPINGNELSTRSCTSWSGAWTLPPVRTAEEADSEYGMSRERLVEDGGPVGAAMCIRLHASGHG